MMRCRPAIVYRNLAYLLGCVLIVYTGYSIIGYDDGAHISHPKNPKHLYITVDRNRIEHRFDKLAPKRILMWTSVFGNYPNNQYMLECPGLSDRCIIDHNRDLISSADAVLFHAPNLDERKFPEAHLRNASQRYVFMTMEAPVNIQKKPVPNNYFNWTMTHLFASNVLFKYGGFWLTAKEAEGRGFKIQDHYVAEKLLRKSKTGIFGLISNCNTPSKRELAIQELAKYMPVTIAGSCATKPEEKDLCPKGKPCDLFKDYPFYFAIENTICEDYVTEKYWERTSIPSIPIVMRRSVYNNVHLPSQSVISMDDFSSPSEMALFLGNLEKNLTAYSKYFKWTRGGWTLAPWMAPGYRNGYCKLCEKLWDKDEPAKTVDDVWSWFDAESKCEGDEFVQKWIKG